MLIRLQKKQKMLFFPHPSITRPMRLLYKTAESYERQVLPVISELVPLPGAQKEADRWRRAVDGILNWLAEEGRRMERDLAPLNQARLTRLLIESGQNPFIARYEARKRLHGQS